MSLMLFLILFCITGTETCREGNHGNARGFSRKSGESYWSARLPEHQAFGEDGALCLPGRSRDAPGGFSTTARIHQVSMANAKPSIHNLPYNRA